MSKQPHTLAKFFDVKRAAFRLIKPSEFAHVIIDAQRAYCDPTHKYRRGNTHTQNVAARLWQELPHSLDKLASEPPMSIMITI